MTDEKVDYKNSVQDNIGTGSSASLRSEQQADENVLVGHLQGLAVANAQRQLMPFETGILNIDHVNRTEVEKGKKKSTTPPSSGDVNADKKDGGIANLQDFVSSNANAQGGREGTAMEIKKVLAECSTSGLFGALHHNEKELIAATVTGSPESVEDLKVEEASNIMNESVNMNPAEPPYDFLVTKEIVLQENSDSVMNNIRRIRQIRDLTGADINLLHMGTCYLIRENSKLYFIPSEYKDSSSNKIIIKGRKDDVETAYELINKLLAVIKERSFTGPDRSDVSASGIGYLHSEELSTDGYIEVHVRAIENPNQFWLQIRGTKWDQLQDLITEMTKFYDEEIHSPENKDSLKMNSISAGDIVAAFDQDDKAWCRAQVVKVSKDQKYVTVFNLDSGAILSPNLLCILNPMFFTLPFQAIECCLAGVKPKYDQWSEEAIDTFDDIVNRRADRRIKAKPIDKLLSLNGGNDLQKTVQLVKLLDLDTGGDVSRELIYRGYGRSGNEYSVLREGKNRKTECACVLF